MTTMQIIPAQILGGAGGGLTLVTGTDANTTMAVNSEYIVDMSAWSTADRNYTCPASPTVGDRVAILVQVGNASFELVIKGNTSQTINGGSSASEWSRLFITSERVTLLYVASNTWIVEDDGRIPMTGVLRLSTNATGESVATFTYPTAKGGAWTADKDTGSVCATGSDKIVARRACSANIFATIYPVSAISIANYFAIAIELNGSGANQILYTQISSGAGAAVALSCARTYPFALDDYIRYTFRSQEGSRGVQSGGLNDSPTVMSFSEIL